MADALLAEIDVQLAKQFHHMGCGGLAPHDQASVGQALMRDELVGHPVGRQYGIEAPFQIDHQRMVVEAVLMVVHVATVEEECSILRLGYKVVPCGLLLYLFISNIGERLLVVCHYADILEELVVFLDIVGRIVRFAGQHHADGS